MDTLARRFAIFTRATTSKKFCWLFWSPSPFICSERDQIHYFWWRPIFKMEAKQFWHTFRFWNCSFFHIWTDLTFHKNQQIKHLQFTFSWNLTSVYQLRQANDACSHLVNGSVVYSDRVCTIYYAYSQRTNITFKISKIVTECTGAR